MSLILWTKNDMKTSAVAPNRGAIWPFLLGRAIEPTIFYLFVVSLNKSADQ